MMKHYKKIERAIRRVASGPAHYTIGDVTATEHSLRELIEADRYLASKRAASRNHLGLRFVKLRPPGAV